MTIHDEVESPGQPGVPMTIHDEVESPMQTERPAPMRWLTRVASTFEQYGLVFLLLCVVSYFSLAPATGGTFPTSANFSVLIGSQAVIAIVALGVMIPLIGGQFDLSVGAITGLCAVVSASAMAEHGLGVFAGVALSVALGGAVGLVNGVIVSYLRVTSIIATLGTSTLIGGIVSQYTGGASIVGVPAAVTEFGNGSFAGLPNTLYVLVGVSLAVAYMLHWIPIGRYLSAMGSSRPTTILLGIPVVRLTILSYVFSGVLAGIAAALLVSRLGGANPASGLEFTLSALAAVFLGATVISPGRFNTAGVIVAILFLAAISSGLTLSGAPDYVQSYVNGGALIVGVAASALLAARRRQGLAT